MLRGCINIVVLLASLSVPTLVQAADNGIAPASEGWIVSLGVEPRYLPRFVGSDKDTMFPVPLLNWYRPGTPVPFQSSRDGLGFSVWESRTFAVGPTGHLLFGRNGHRDPALSGLRSVSATVELGVFADYWPSSWLRAHTELRQGIGGHSGIVSDLALDGIYLLNTNWTLSGGPRARLASAAAVRPYFSVSAAEAVASGLPTFNAGGGLQSIGAGTQARYQVSWDWSTHFVAEFDRLLGDTAASPIVSQRGSANQWTFGAGFTRAFLVSGK